MKNTKPWYIVKSNEIQHFGKTLFHMDGNTLSAIYGTGHATWCPLNFVMYVIKIKYDQPLQSEDLESILKNVIHENIMNLVKYIGFGYYWEPYCLFLTRFEELEQYSCKT